VLGQVAGNLALTLGATDGIFVAGGIVRRYPELLKASGFRSGFENKGRHRSLMERVPSSLIIHEQPGLLGASEVARRLHRQLGRQKKTT
jgi:glucokinase